MLSKNVINEVIKEWSWRVSTGMPDITKTEDLKLLREVLINDFNLSVYDADKIIEGLSKVKYKNLSYAALAMKPSKSTQLNGFLNGITTEAAQLIKPTLDMLEKEQEALQSKNKGLKPTDPKYKVGKNCNDFLEILHSVSKVKGLKSVPGSGIESTIFELGGGTGKPGKGEVWASVMVPKTVVVVLVKVLI